jgi:hypothetical protein
MGKLKAEAGDNEKAIEIWVQALKNHPDPALVQDAIARARRRIAATTPDGVDRKPAFDRNLRKNHRSFIEAVGGSAEEEARDHGD